ncbi:MAG: hypothetical protein ACXAC7_10830 [Candidatus Hodarchaeales archaeon]|jgi:hypothetical protein
MKELDDRDLEKIHKLILSMEEHQGFLRKRVVHPLRGTSIHKISETKYKDAISTAKRVLDHNDKQLKLLKKLLT